MYQGNFGRHRTGARYLALALATVVGLGVATAIGLTQSRPNLRVSAETLSKLKGAKSSYGSYIVIMRGSGAVGYGGSVAGYQATRPAAGEKIDPSAAHVAAYVAFLESLHDGALAAVGASGTKVHDYCYAANGFSARLTAAQAGALAAQADVTMVLADELQQPLTERSPDFLGLTDKKGAWDSGYDGEGIIVGIIDSGIWPEHPSFADPDPSGEPYDPPAAAPPGGYLCEFGNDTHNPLDAAFTCNNKLIGAYQMLDTYRFVFGAEADERNMSTTLRHSQAAFSEPRLWWGDS